MDVVPRWKVRLRALRPFRVIARVSLGTSPSIDRFLEEMGAARHEGSAGDGPASRTLGLWRMEKLAFCYCRAAGGRLDDPRIPPEVQPIAHVGLGVAAMERGAVETQAVVGGIETRAHPDYRLFAYEALGCIWAVTADRWLRRVFRLVARTPIPPSDFGPWNDFAGRFPAEVRSLLAHGVGRMLYFRHAAPAAAVRAATGVPGLDVPAAVQGISFARAMVNHRDLDRLLEADAPLADPALAAAFDGGLVYALAFWEWAYPSFLEAVPSSTDRRAALLAGARELVEESRGNGSLVVFVAA